MFTKWGLRYLCIGEAYKTMAFSLGTGLCGKRKLGLDISLYRKDEIEMTQKQLRIVYF